MLKLDGLDSTHDRIGFACGEPPLNDYLQRTARQHIEKGLSKTFVLVEEPSVAPKPSFGFFTISICEMRNEQLPRKLGRKLPQRIPAMRLGRLAVSLRQQGAGLGRLLLVEALRRVANVADWAGGAGLVVDAKDEAVATFYAKMGFEEADVEPLTLFMPTSTVQRIARDSAP
ncbi:MAG TPA: GNAT family N-acetyltransferase [Chthoniobacteraceae bacterium]|nr:GNAT family N-acetyltransferase [Chthoniobacteraceae bacterium]